MSSRPRVALVARQEAGVTGTSRYVFYLSEQLVNSGVDVRLAHPEPAPSHLIGLGRRLGIGLDTFQASYPLRVAAGEADEVDVYHLASQNLATLLWFKKFRRPVVVTVHDIIPYLIRNDRHLSSYRHAIHRFFDFLAMRGLKRADLILADSKWTRATLISELGIDPGRIQVVYLGVDAERFRPMAVPDDFWRRYDLDPRRQHLLYVGSDDPRKNLASLLQAFSTASRRHPELRLVRVGPMYRPTEASRLTVLSRKLGINAKVSSVGPVSEQDLAMFYNAADLVVVPSTLEGFGLPVLESLACGTRVVCSNTASLPEVAGSDSITCGPVPDALASAVSAGLADDSATARESRRCWARRFSWTRTVEQVASAYARVCEQARRER